MRIVFFILMSFSILSGMYGPIDALFVNPAVFDVVEKYNFIYPYYGFLGFFFWGGLALFLALITRKEWGYQLALIWVWIGIAYTAIFGLLNYFDPAFMFQYVLATAPGGERDIGSLAEGMTSQAYRIGSNAATPIFLIIGLAYLSMVRRNRDYFSY